MAAAGAIRVGVGGWTFEPWEKGVFYPEGLSKAKQLRFNASVFTANEVNGTYYSSFKPPTFAKWRDETPDGFVFAIKASRYCTNRKVLSDGGESIARFFSQGLGELGPKLGPILWQFMATKKFDSEDFGGFLKLLPREIDGLPARHAIQVRNASFHTPAFVDLCRAQGVAIVFADHADYPATADVTADFVYARLENAAAEVVTGYTPDAIAGWADAARTWARGGAPDGLPYADSTAPPAAPRDVFVFMINGAKERAPAAGQALLARL